MPLDRDIVKAANSISHRTYSSQLSQQSQNQIGSQANGLRDLTKLIDDADPDVLLSFVEKRAEGDRDVAEYIKAVFLGDYECKCVV